MRSLRDCHAYMRAAWLCLTSASFTIAHLTDRESTCMHVCIRHYAPRCRLGAHEFVLCAMTVDIELLCGHSGASAATLPYCNDLPAQALAYLPLMQCFQGFDAVEGPTHRQCHSHQCILQNMRCWLARKLSCHTVCAVHNFSPCSSASSGLLGDRCSECPTSSKRL